MRAWVDEGGEGVLLSCALEEPDDFDTEDDEFGEAVVLGRAEVPAPEIGEPAAYTETDHYEWAVAIFILVDADILDPEEALEALAEGELDEAIGIWGVADSTARLHGEGDMTLLGDDIVAGQVPPDLDDGTAWMGFIPQLVAATGTFAGALTDLEPDVREGIDDVGIPVRHVDTLDDATLRLLSGEPFGGLALADDCEEEFEEDEEDEEEEEFEEERR